MKQKVILLAGDWLALALFVFIGQLEHELVAANPLPGLLLSTAVLILPWTVVVLLWGAFRLPTGARDWSFFGRFFTAWLVAGPLALLLRAYLRGQATIIVIFMAITLGLGGLFLLGWRLLFFYLTTRQSARH